MKLKLFFHHCLPVWCPVATRARCSVALLCLNIDGVWMWLQIPFFGQLISCDSMPRIYPCLWIHKEEIFLLIPTPGISVNSSTSELVDCLAPQVIFNPFGNCSMHNSVLQLQEAKAHYSGQIPANLTMTELNQVQYKEDPRFSTKLHLAFEGGYSWVDQRNLLLESKEVKLVYCIIKICIHAY